MRLEGKIALVTGGGTGIGAAITRRFVKEGAKVCIAGRRKAKLEETAASCPKGSVKIFAGDVSNYEDVKGIIAKTLEFNGKLNIVVNDAAIDTMGRITDMEPAEWRKMMEINLTAPYVVMRESIPHMIKNGGGSIINIASLAALRCLPGGAAYCTSKAALIMLTKTVAMDYSPEGIRCNVICPGATMTEMNKALVKPLSDKLGAGLDAAYKVFTKNVPARRAAQPDEIAGLACYLASDESSFMTGATLPIDGGASIVDIMGATLMGAMTS